MEKTKIESFIKKYYLGGLLEKARWSSKNGTLSTRTKTEDGKILVMVDFSGFDSFDVDEIGVGNTTELLRMLTVIGDNINPTLVRTTDGVVIGLDVSDDKIEMIHQLHDLDTFKAAPVLKSVPEFTVELILDTEFIGRFLKAKSALDNELFTLVMNPKTNKLQLVMNYSNINSSRIAISVNATVGKDTVKQPISFSAKVLKEIISANSEVKDPILKVSEAGLAFIEFVNNGITSKYYLIEVGTED